MLGDQTRQAGSLVAPDKLRFDFNYPAALTHEQLLQIEKGVNEAILDEYDLNISVKPLEKAINEGAMALFGEKYGQEVRTIKIGGEETLSYELCGGTVLICEIGNSDYRRKRRGAGVRRIEAVTGQAAYIYARERMNLCKIRQTLGASPAELQGRLQALQDELAKMEARTERDAIAQDAFGRQLDQVAHLKRRCSRLWCPGAGAKCCANSRPVSPALPLGRRRFGFRAGWQTVDYRGGHPRPDSARIKSGRPGAARRGGGRRRRRRQT